MTPEVVFAVIGLKDQLDVGLDGKYQVGSAELSTLFCVVRFEVVETMHSIETSDPPMSNRRLNCQSGLDCLFGLLQRSAAGGSLPTDEGGLFSDCPCLGRRAQHTTVRIRPLRKYLGEKRELDEW